MSESGLDLSVMDVADRNGWSKVSMPYSIDFVVVGDGHVTAGDVESRLYAHALHAVQIEVFSSRRRMQAQ